MHTKDVLGEVVITKKLIRKFKSNAENPLAGKLPSGPRDIVTYLFLKAGGAKKVKAATSVQALDGHRKGVNAKDESAEPRASGPDAMASSSGGKSPNGIPPAKTDDECSFCDDGGVTNDPKGCDLLEFDIESDDESDWDCLLYTSPSPRDS